MDLQAVKMSFDTWTKRLQEALADMRAFIKRSASSWRSRHRHLG
jgi:hypothetical protein